MTDTDDLIALKRGAKTMRERTGDFCARAVDVCDDRFPCWLGQTLLREAIANLHDALKPLAQSIVDIVEKDLKQTAIAVGDFNSPPGFDANAGPGISESLKA